MRVALANVLTGVVLLFQSAAAAPEAGVKPAPAGLSKDVETLVRELGDESYRVREQATKELWNLGETVLPALKELEDSSGDPERMIRARDLIRKIQLHIGPDTDPGVIALVERYAKASLTEKSALLGKMKGKRAWRQMLKLYAAETRPEAREKLRLSLNGVAVRAARERLLQGDADGAREFLEMAPVDAESLMALAVFHRSHGSLEAELANALKGEGVRAAAWQLALYRAAGNIEAARGAAEAAGETRTAALMAALSGDPLPWLGIFSMEDGDQVEKIYSALAAQRWEGEKLRPGDLEPLVKRLGARDPSERGAALNALFLLGETRAAEAAFAKHEPLTAFRHFESLERIPDAVKALGLAPENPDYTSWVAKRAERLANENIEDQHDVSEHGGELVALANFLERRGMHEEALDAFAAPLNRLAEKDENDFVDFLGELFGSRETLSGAPLLARRIGAAWAADQPKRWEELVVAAFGDDDQSSDWWEWLEEIDPSLPVGERFDAMLGLFRLGPDPRGLRDQWMRRVWKAIEDAPEGERAVLATRVSTLCIETGDAANSLKAWDMMPDSARSQIFWGQHITHLSAAERWNEAAAAILRQITAQSEGKAEASPDLHAYAAAALRLAGKNDEAAAHDQWAEKLYLGNPSIAIRIGNGYAFGRDYRRAAVWWARAAWEADPESPEFLLAIKVHSDALLEDGKWRESASTSELLARVYASSDYRWNNPLPFMRQRLQADMARALSRLKSHRSASIATLEACHRVFASDGSLADFFFPSLRREGLIREHDRWFGETWDLMEDVIARYPESDNTRNTAAWFASRAVRKLDEAAKHLAIALAARPDQPAYLDTMAEIQFAKGNRDKALEWSAKAINFEPDDPLIRRQHERFRADPLPK